LPEIIIVLALFQSHGTFIITASIRPSIHPSPLLCKFIAAVVLCTLRQGVRR